MIKIIGYDPACEDSGGTAIQFKLPKYKAIDPLEFPQVGEEFHLTEWELKRLGLPPTSKIIATSVFERDGIPYMTGWVR